jgi:hypothetical protein
MYVDIIVFVMCRENHTICNVYINLTQHMFGSCFTSCLFVYLFLMIQNGYAYRFCDISISRNIIQSGLCNIIVHAEIKYKRNNDLFYSLNVYKKRVVYLLCVFTIWVPCCDFHIQTMVGSYFTSSCL